MRIRERLAIWIFNRYRPEPRQASFAIERIYERTNTFTKEPELVVQVRLTGVNDETLEPFIMSAGDNLDVTKHFDLTP